MKKKTQTDMQTFLRGIDFKLLKKQKKTFLEVARFMNYYKSTVTKDLDGILQLVDKVQELSKKK